MKKLVKILAVLAAVLVIAVTVAVLMVDRIARAGVESGATYALGVETTLDNANVRIMSGDFTMSGLKVANPEGFDADHFFRLNEGDVNVSLGSLTEDTVRLPHLTLSGIDVHLLRSGGASNYQKIIENLERFESGDKGGDDAASGKRFVIEKITIQDVTAHVNLVPVGGDLTKLDVKVDEIVLEDVGSGGDQGALLGELTSVIVNAVLVAILEKGGDIIPKEMLTELTSGLADLEKFNDLTVQIKGAAGQIGDAGKAMKDGAAEVGKAADDAVKGLGNLLKGGDDD